MINVKRFSMLTKWQKTMFAIGFFMGLIMVSNTIYLLFSAHVTGIGRNPEVLPLFYQLMLISHLGLGVIFVLFGCVFAAMHVKKVLKRRKKRPWMRMTGVLFIGSLLMLFLSGFFILSESNSRDNFWVFVSHQVLAVFFVGGYIAHRVLSRVKPVFFSKLETFFLNEDGTLGTPVVGTFVITCAIVIFASAAIKVSAAEVEGKVNQTDSSEPVNTKEYQNNVDAYIFVPEGVPQTDSVFFPATTSTSTGKWLPSRIITHDDLPDLEAFRKETEKHGFAPSYYLGAQSCSRCHADIVQQWSTSAHRFSSFNNPFYRKSVELTREKIGNKASQFCGGCHDPAVMLAGSMVKEIDPLTPESQAGITCLGCHAIDKVHGVIGNGNYNIHDKTESPYVFDQAKSGIAVEVHDYVLKAKPTVHKQRNMKPIFKKSEFCMACHKVNLDVEVNGYRWLRGQNEYDSWHNSGVARNQPKTWYEPPTVRQCQDCHMPLEEAVMGDVAADNGMVRSHRFLSVNTALPALRGDTDTIARMEKFMQDGMLRMEIFAIRRENGEVILNTHENAVMVEPGETIQVDIVVRNQNVGHAFPGGTNDSNEGWIDFHVKSGEKTVFHNGGLREDKHVDPAAHFYKAVIVDRHGERIAKRNASDIYSVVYANVIAPSTSDIARYKFKVPKAEGEHDLTIDAKLKWRKFNREFTEFVFEGKEIPDLPITLIESDNLKIRVTKNAVNNEAADFADEDPKRWVRYNDYGIGSILDGDTKTALSAFEKVKKLEPEKMDGYLNQARAYLSEGSLKNAETMLRKASEKAPNEPRLAFFWGVLLEKKGQLDEAISAFKRTLQAYPESRDTLIRLGRVYWLNSDYEESIEAYQGVLKIDPEHAQAFHQLNLAHKALAANAKTEVQAKRYSDIAKEYEKGFEKYKIDEDARAVTHSYREENPFDNLMSQKIIIHEEG